MEFAREKSAILIKKWEAAKGIELRNWKNFWMLEEKKRKKYLVIFDADTIKQAEMKRKKKKITKYIEKATWKRALL